MQHTSLSSAFEDSLLTIGVNTSTIDFNQIYSGSTDGYKISVADSTSPVYVYDTPSSGLKVNGGAEINGPLKVDGVDIGSAIQRIEERLAILRPNTELEERWVELMELGQRYRALEAELLQKEKIIEILES